MEKIETVLAESQQFHLRLSKQIPTPANQRHAGMTKHSHAEFNQTHQRDEITDEERRLIDEAVSSGMVQKIPTGASSLVEDYVWKGRRDDPSYVGTLVAKNPITLKERNRRRRESAIRLEKHRSKFRKTDRQIADEARISARREKVLELFLAGKNQAEVAREVGFCARTIRQDRAWLRAKGRLEQAGGRT